MSDDLAGRLVVKTPRRLLDELAVLAPKLASRPEVELHLPSGVIRGRVIAIGEADGVVLVQTGGNPAAPSVAYVRADQVLAVIVVDASVLVRPVIADAPAPSKLELARALGARAESLTPTLGRALPLTTSGELDEAGRRAVAALLPPLIDSLRAIAREELGKPALDKLAGIELGAGPRLEVRKDGPTLAITASRSEATPADRLRAEIERVL